METDEIGDFFFSLAKLAKAGRAAFFNAGETECDDGTVFSHERHHVGHGAERGEFYEIGDTLFVFERSESAGGDGGEQFERDSGPGEIGKRVRRIRHLRVDEGDDAFRNDFRYGVMVGNDDVYSEFLRAVYGFHVPGSTIHRDDEFHVGLGEFVDEIRLHAVSVFDAVGQAVGDLHSHGLEKPHEHCRRRYSVHVVVSKNHDAFLVFPRFQDARYRVIHSRKKERIVQIGKRRREERRKIAGRIDAAVLQNDVAERSGRVV